LMAAQDFNRIFLQRLVQTKLKLSDPKNFSEIRKELLDAENSLSQTENLTDIQQTKANKDLAEAKYELAKYELEEARRVGDAGCIQTATMDHLAATDAFQGANVIATQTAKAALLTAQQPAGQAERLHAIPEGKGLPPKLLIHLKSFSGIISGIVVVAPDGWHEAVALAATALKSGTQQPRFWMETGEPAITKVAENQEQWTTFLLRHMPTDGHLKTVVLRYLGEGATPDTSLDDSHAQTYVFSDGEVSCASSCSTAASVKGKSMGTDLNKRHLQ